MTDEEIDGLIEYLDRQKRRDCGTECDFSPSDLLAAFAQRLVDENHRLKISNLQLRRRLAKVLKPQTARAQTHAHERPASGSNAAEMGQVCGSAGTQDTKRKQHQ